MRRDRGEQELPVQKEKEQNTLFQIDYISAEIGCACVCVCVCVRAHQSVNKRKLRLKAPAHFPIVSIIRHFLLR